MMRSRIATLVGTLVLACAAPPGLAASQNEPTVNEPTANEPTATGAGETPEQARVRLNTAQAAAAKAQLAQNAASQQAHDDAVRAAAATLAKQQAEIARQQADYQAAMDKWKADVAACQAGDVAHCATGPR